MKNYSRQREAILNVISSTHTHPTADWIYNETRKIIPNLSLGTVYRNLSALKKSGEISSVDVGTARSISILILRPIFTLPANVAVPLLMPRLTEILWKICRKNTALSPKRRFMWYTDTAKTVKNKIGFYPLKGLA